MIFRTGNRPTNTLQPVAIEAAIRHQQAIGSAGHLLSCADYLLQALPEAVEDLPVIGDLSVLLTKVGEEIQAARVRFQPVEITPQQDAEEEAAARVAPWRKDFQPPRPVAPPQVAPIATGMIDQVDKIRAIADGMDENCETAIALNQIAAQLEIESVVLSRLAA